MAEKALLSLLFLMSLSPPLPLSSPPFTSEVWIFLQRSDEAAAASKIEREAEQTVVGQIERKEEEGRAVGWKTWPTCIFQTQDSQPLETLMLVVGFI